MQQQNENRFSLARLFGYVTVVAVLCLIPVKIRGCYYAERYAISRLLADRDVENLSLGAFDEGAYEEVVTTKFNLAGRPEAVMRLIDVESCSRNGEFKSLGIQQLGPWVFYPPGDFGSESPFAHLLPFPVTNLDELIDNYNALVAHLDTWPRWDCKGTIVVDGRDISYYVKRRPSKN